MITNKSVVKELIDAGADPNAKNHKGDIPLHTAATFFGEGVMKLLLDKGSDPNAKNNDGEAPLHRAKNENVAKFLLAAGADINAQDNDGRTPLHTAVREGKNNVAKFLIDAGADINAQDNDGRPPLHTAVREGINDVANFLLAAGADIDAQDNDGRTPLHYAAERGRTDVAKLLLDAGADPNARNEEPVAAKAEIAAGLTMEVARAEDIARELEYSKVMESEARSRYRKMVESRFGGGENTTRPLAALPDPALLDALDDEFPIFSEVTRSVREQARLSWKLRDTAGEQPAHFRPILIEGKPGYGKSAYVRRLAEIVGAPFREMQMGSMTAGFVLSGNDLTWQGSKPGIVFEEVTGRAANPVLLLDELDKISNDRHSRPDGALYSLLEKDSAKRFVDEFASFPIDASAISWVATANDAERIHDALLSRFEIFSIPDPTAEQARATLLQVYRGILRENPWGVLFDSTPDAELIEALISLSPREAKRRLLRAFGACVDSGAGPTVNDLPPEARPSRSIGFHG